MDRKRRSPLHVIPYPLPRTTAAAMAFIKCGQIPHLSTSVRGAVGDPQLTAPLQKPISESLSESSHMLYLSARPVFSWSTSTSPTSLGLSGRRKGRQAAIEDGSACQSSLTKRLPQSPPGHLQRFPYCDNLKENDPQRERHY